MMSGNYDMTGEQDGEGQDSGDQFCKDGAGSRHHHIPLLVSYTGNDKTAVYGQRICLRRDHHDLLYRAVGSHDVLQSRDGHGCPAVLGQEIQVDISCLLDRLFYRIYKQCGGSRDALVERCQEVDGDSIGHGARRLADDRGLRDILYPRRVVSGRDSAALCTVSGSVVVRKEKLCSDRGRGICCIRRVDAGGQTVLDRHDAEYRIFLHRDAADKTQRQNIQGSYAGCCICGRMYIDLGHTCSGI